MPLCASHVFSHYYWDNTKVPSLISKFKAKYTRLTVGTIQFLAPVLIVAYNMKIFGHLMRKPMDCDTYDLPHFIAMYSD